MWIVRLPSQPPYTFVVMSILTLAIGVLSIFSHPDRHFPEHQRSGLHHLELQRHGCKGRPSRTHTSHSEGEASKPPASSLLLGFPDTDYPLPGKTIVVTRCGRICLDQKTINFSQVFAWQAVGSKDVHDDIGSGQLYGS